LLFAIQESLNVVLNKFLNLKFLKRYFDNVENF
jgi:hypothetical protein